MRSHGISGPNREVTWKTSSAMPSWEVASAARTSRPSMASTPATRANRPGRSAVMTETVVPSASTTVSPRAITWRCWASGKSAVLSDAWAPPSKWWSTRRTSSRTSSAFQVPHAAGPVASESASVSAASRWSRTGSTTSLATIAMVVSSEMSRRVAMSGRRRWLRHRSTSTAVSASSKPMRGPISAIIAMPTSVWSPGRPLAMSWRRAPTTSRSGRSTRSVSCAALADASSRCRSTVKRW